MHAKFKQLTPLLIGLIILLTLLYMGFSYYVASRVVAPHPTKITASPSLIGSNYEVITIAGIENTKLHGWFIKGTNDKVIIMVHGVKEDRVNSGYNAMAIAKELVTKGYSVLMYDGRAHGESEGKYTTMGTKESRDLHNVIAFAQTKGYEKKDVGIISNSLGSITVLLALEDLEEIGAIIVDSPPATVAPVLKHILKEENGIPAFFNPGIFFMVKTVYGIDIDTIRPIDHVVNVPDRKFLFLHGTSDDPIPHTNSEQLLQRANKESTLVLFENAEHVQTYKSNPEKYRDAVFTFLEEELGKN